jgi:type VI secretion system secreted protein VgrG
MTRKSLGLVASVGLVTLLCAPSRASAQTAPPLGALQSFGVLASSTVTNTGSSIITGDLGVSPGSAVIGFPPGLVVSGTIHAADGVALAAQNALTTAYNVVASQACTQDLTGQDLGGKTLTAGVYCFSSSAQLTGILTLNAQGNANAIFLFKIGSTLTTASGASVVVINGGSQCNVFWQVGTSATLGTVALGAGSSFAGNILALTSITLTTGASVTGRVLARNGAITLDTNTINTQCLAVLLPAPVPTLSEWAFIMLAVLLATAGVVALRRRTSAL